MKLFPHPSTVFAGIGLLMAGWLAVATPAAAQYGGNWGSYEEPAAIPQRPKIPPTPTRRPTLRPTPTPKPGSVELAFSCRRANGKAAGRTSHGELSLLPNETLECSVYPICSPLRPGNFDVSITPLSGGVSVSPTSGSGPCNVNFRVEVRAGPTPGSFPVLITARHVRGSFPGVTTMVTMAVQPAEPRIVTSSGPIAPVPNPKDLEFRARTRSWRAALWLRHFIYPDWVHKVADDLVHSSAWRRAVASATAIDRGKIGVSGQWPKRQTYRSYARMETVMSQYWADGSISLSASTANEVGNVFLAWRRNPGLTVTLDQGIARLAGSGGHVVKIGNALNGVGFAMILLDFWNNAASAETPVEAREAWYKAGYSSLDLYLSNAVGDTFGAATALPGMFVSYILTNSYNTLISGHKACWYKKMTEVAVAEHWLGTGIRDRVAVDKVLKAMKSPEGLRKSLIDWWRTEEVNWAGEMAGGCGSWTLAEARGYTEAFVDRLMHAQTVQVKGRTYSPVAFYWAVSRELIRQREEKLAEKTAHDLVRLEAAYLSNLHRQRLHARLRLVTADDPNVPIANARVRPVDWDSGSGWTTDEDGWFTAQLRGDDFSPSGTATFLVRTPSGGWIFALQSTAFEEDTP